MAAKPEIDEIDMLLETSDEEEVEEAEQIDWLEAPGGRRWEADWSCERAFCAKYRFCLCIRGNPPSNRQGWMNKDPHF